MVRIAHGLFPSVQFWFLFNFALLSDQLRLLQRILPSVKGNNKARSDERALFTLFARIQNAKGILTDK